MNLFNPHISSSHISNSNVIDAQKGFSLIELLITMVIGLFLLSGIASSYISSKKASVNRSQISILEDNGRLALEIISKSLQHTGHAPNLLLEKPFIEDLANVVADTCPDGTVNVVDTGIFKVSADNDALGQDTIGVVFYGNDNIFTDCAGNTMNAVVPVGCRLSPLPNVNTAPESSKIYNSFYVDDVKKTLECAGSRSAAGVTIADGVENIQFLYGVDNNSDGTVDRYVNATEINATATDSIDWSSVITIQTAILVRSLKAIKTQAEIQKFTLLDVVIAAPNDKFQRAVFSTTIHLHNTL